MNGNTRRNKILEILNNTTVPVSGAVLSKSLEVSRQVIVQDIALLRAENKNILSTNKGYILFHQDSCNDNVRKVIMVSHTTDQILDEFFTIVDLGGKILDVFIEHELYGQIEVDLIIQSRLDAEEFVQKMHRVDDKPLKELTCDIHYHTIEAPSKDHLNRITQRLSKKGYLLK